MENQKPQNKLEDVPKEQRAAMLIEMATKKDFMKIRRTYTREEKAQMKDFVSDESITVMDQKEAMAVIQKEFSAKMKEFSKQITDALKNLKKGYSENEEDVFLFDDQDSGLMHIYDADGVYQSSRPLYPEERQTKILEMTGTHN